MSFSLPPPPPRYDGVDIDTWVRRVDDYLRNLNKTLYVLDRLSRDSLQELATKETYTVTNHTADTTLDADASSAAINADVLGSLIQTLITAKIITGSVT
jgi:hypothetical protein